MKKNGRQRLFEIMEKINPDFQQKKPKLILPVGISGSGKSTWIKSQTDSNTIVVSPDDIRRELTGSISDQRKNGEVWSTAFDRVVNALNMGKNVILDATNIKSSDRKRLLNHLKVNVDRPFDAFAKIFNVDPEVAKKRVRKDIESGVDRSNVPDYAIDRQYQDFIDGVNTLETDGFKIMDEDVVRSTNTDKPELDLTKKYSQGDETSRFVGKPRGLWYGINDSWTRFCSQFSGWLRKYDIILDIDFSNIIVLDTDEKVIVFTQKYKAIDDSGDDYYINHIRIDWEKVALDYKGIEMPNIGELKTFYTLSGKFGGYDYDSWLREWDMNSGCIWDLSAIKNYTVKNCEMKPQYNDEDY